MVRATSQILKPIRLDKGSKTLLIIKSHTLLRRATKPNLQFEHISSFGKSVKNQYIEAWWNILTHRQLENWKHYFGRLEKY